MPIMSERTNLKFKSPNDAGNRGRGLSALGWSKSQIPGGSDIDAHVQ
jgi:hypothetical protein